MGTFLDLRNAGSRVIRSEATQGALRVLAPGASLDELDEEEEGGIVKKTLKFLWKFGGFLANKIGIPAALKSLTGLVGWLSNAASFIWNFNWNVSEEQIEIETQYLLLQLAGQAGGLAGQALGWLFCGALPGMTIITFNQALGLKILKDVGEEAFDEIGSTFQILFNSAAAGFSRIAFLKLYASTRRLYYKFKGKTAPDFSKKKPWSFATAWEERLDDMDNRHKAEALEEGREEFAEACTEAFYVVAHSVESFVMEQALAEQAQPGNQERTIEIDFNRGATA
ncbi:hypothetical protein IQ249_24770 [Lusitaniella coriacea LEGE 07157]|uniref:Uncharacterized protein n=1 Tax=Lusitaniella coriacea LEGE 07157 TaxID=945747 RepID=A0A8J7J6Y7_9CYAN|nr:hypothetical protein [Lusitaniella coriacea]MBE9119074.1 hypothetical protein [Lusitaniella coriacea LEGE 07157]